MEEVTAVAGARRSASRPQELREVARRQSTVSDRRLVVVSNRVAIDGEQQTSGGLAVAVRAALENSGGIWFGWSGRVESLAADQPDTVVRGPLTYATVDLSQRDFDEYYLGFANRVLWPLFHLRAGLVDYARQDF